LKKGTESLFEWLQGMLFKLEMIQGSKEGLKETQDRVKKILDRAFELMKDLHSNPQVSGQGKALIGIEVMKNNFSTYLSNLSGMVSSSPNRVMELQTLGGCVHVASIELENQTNTVKELA
jgi:hypothetical protein